MRATNFQNSSLVSCSSQPNTYYSDGMKHKTRARMKQKKNNSTEHQQLNGHYTHSQRHRQRHIHSFDWIFMSHTTTVKSGMSKKKENYDECVFNKRAGCSPSSPRSCFCVVVVFFLYFSGEYAANECRWENTDEK